VKSTQEIFRDLADLSRAASGWCVFNPNVAAAIFDANGELAATGVHKKKVSDDHAEVVALKAAGAKAQGGTLYVSLEPCNHTGATAPCVEAIQASGIKKVVYAVNDPNPVAQGGAKALLGAGVEVIYEKSPELEFEQRAWLHRMVHGRPLITAKIASTLDGQIAASDGSSKWITSESSRQDVQALRSQVGAIITSTATYLADTPSLLPRIEGAPTPLRVVMGKRAINAPDFKVIASHEFRELLELLNSEGVNHALVEAGGTFLSALLRADLIDELVIYQAPKILGSGTSWVEDLGVTTLSDAITLETLSVAPIGADIRTHYRIVRS
jgi:diaminohydroxyphosphoribosylaminopyrimidine deaminase/5-amino-6-(5-phosphoribosylamino)uracil reductase